MLADPSGRAVSGVSLGLLAYWDCGFGSRRGHECLSVLNVVFRQFEVTASDWSLVQGTPIDYDVSESDREVSIMRRLWLPWDCCAMKKKVFMLTPLQGRIAAKKPVTAPILCTSLWAQAQSRRTDEETIVFWPEREIVLTSWRRKPTGVEIYWALEPI